MKNTLLVIAVLFVGGCAGARIPITRVPPSMQSVAGIYETSPIFEGIISQRLVLTIDGVAHHYDNKIKSEHNFKWQIKNDEIHTAGEDGNVVIYKIVGPPGEFLFPVGILQKDGASCLH